MGEQGAGSRGRELRRARRRRRKRVESANEAPEVSEAPEADGRERLLSALGNQGVQRLLRGGGAREPAPAVQRQGYAPGPEGEESGVQQIDVSQRPLLFGEPEPRRRRLPRRLSRLLPRVGRRGSRFKRHRPGGVDDFRSFPDRDPPE